MSKEIKRKVEAKLYIPLTDLHGIQGELKTMTRESFEDLKETILNDGITFAFHVWKNPETNLWMIIDGHGRCELLRHLVNVEGYICPDIPCAEIQADTFRDAKKLVLNSTAVYHQTTKQGLYEFISDIGMSVDDLKKFKIPEINFDSFKAEFYSNIDVPIEEPQEKEGPKKKDFTPINCPNCGVLIENG